MKERGAAGGDLFRSVKRRFLLLHMVSLSLLLIGVLAAVMVVTMRTTMAEQWEILERNTWKQPPWLSSGGPQPTPGQYTRAKEPRMAGSPPDLTQVFDILTDDEGQIIATNSSFVQEEDEAYAVALEAARRDGGERGTLHIGDTHWLYIHSDWDEAQYYSFLDITGRHNMLVQLSIVLGAAGLGALALVYVLSRVFAERAIRPMRETWNRQNQFLLDASHELRTPLTVIAANVDLVLSAPEETVGSQRKWLGFVKDEAKRMTGLTNDLLWIARHDIEREQESFVDADLSAAANSAATGMEALLFEKGIEFETDVQPDVHVPGNPQQLEQAALILLDNACKYTEPGGKVRLEVRCAGKEAHIAVTNTGEGIATEHTDRVFDRFYRTDAARNRGAGGHGLGLSIARAIVARHRGRIAVKSVPGETTTFTITLKCMQR